TACLCFALGVALTCKPRNARPRTRWDYTDPNADCCTVCVCSSADCSFRAALLLLQPRPISLQPASASRVNRITQATGAGKHEAPQNPGGHARRGGRPGAGVARPSPWTADPPEPVRGPR